MSMKIMNDEEVENSPYNIGVHVTHCCGLHGCKYGHDDCPVQKGEYAQQYACEYCRSVNTLQEKIYSLNEEMKWAEKLKSIGVEIPNDNGLW